MEYITLGKTGLRVSRMGFGGIPIQKVDAAVTRKLMERLVERGVNYIDTARGYTVSESFLGEALEGGLREKFVLATKSMARTRAEMERDIEISLRNLRTDHIDLYQVHNPSLAELEQVTAPGGALEALLADSPECMRRMKIRRRKMAVGTVRNFCYPGTPYAFWERVRRAKAYMNRPDIAALFDDVKPSDFPAQLSVKLFLMQRRMAFAMCFLFTYVFDRV